MYIARGLLLRTSTFALLACLAALPAASQPLKVRVGAYVMRIGDFDPSAGSFSVDMWVWTHSPPGSKMQVIETVALKNTKELNDGPMGSEVVNGTLWGTRHYRAKIGHDWDMSRFPFDQHTLVIPLAESQYDVRQMIFVPDQKGSNLDPRVQLGDWEVTGFHIETAEVEFPSHFGDPSAGLRKSVWPEAQVVITIARKGLGTFLKVTFVAYVAFVMLMLSFFLPIEAFNDRLNMLLGSLFAVAVNLRGAESLLGTSDDFNIVDRIHLLVTIFIVCATAVTMIARHMGPPRSRRLSLWTAALVGAVFVAANAAMLAS